jgi:hypothetical protein
MGFPETMPVLVGQVHRVRFPVAAKPGTSLIILNN